MYSEYRPAMVHFFIFIIVRGSRSFLVLHKSHWHFPSNSSNPLGRQFLATTTTTTTTTTISTTIASIEWSACTDCWRPTINDVERISWGKPAKQKGTGSRGVPHRLNEEERTLFDLARTKGFLQVNGSGWRSQRRGSPLVNSHRSLCDARAQPCIVLHKNGQTGVDTVVLDLSTLRLPASFRAIANQCIAKFGDNGRIVREEADYETLTDETACVITLAAADEPSVGGEPTDYGVQPAVKDDVDDEPADSSIENHQWTNQPIYRLPPYSVVWELPRPEAKVLGKSLAEVFSTAEGKKAASQKPVGIKPGKSRRHGGYGIG